MSPATARLVGNVMLTIGVILLLITVAGMSGLIAKIAPSRELIIPCAVLVIGAAALRRRGRQGR